MTVVLFDGVSMYFLAMSHQTRHKIGGVHLAKVAGTKLYDGSYLGTVYVFPALFITLAIGSPVFIGMKRNSTLFQALFGDVAVCVCIYMYIYIYLHTANKVDMVLHLGSRMRKLLTSRFGSANLVMIEAVEVYQRHSPLS